VQTNDAVAYCAEQIRRYDSDRYATALFAPASRRPALYALYAFNLEIAKVREVTSQPLLGEMRLQWWRESLDGIMAGTPRQHAVAIALSEALRTHRLDRRRLDRLIDARSADLDDEPPATVGALTAYVEGTSATLIELALEALDARDEAAMEAGRLIGIAWGLTGLLRAIPFHARARRLYLPADLSAEAGLSSSDLLALRPQPALRTVVRTIAEMARDRLAAARRLRTEVPQRAVPALLTATLASGYLGLLRRAEYDPFDPRAAAPLPSRSWRLLAVRATGRY